MQSNYDDGGILGQEKQVLLLRRFITCQNKYNLGRDEKKQTSACENLNPYNPDLNATCMHVTLLPTSL